MANIRKRGDSYQIRVSCGYDANGKQMTRQMTWKPEEGMTPKQIEKEVNRQAILFEESCMKCPVVTNIRFEQAAEEWFSNYAVLNLRSTSYERMKKLTNRVYPAIGHMKLDKITSRQIQLFINDLLINGRNMVNGNPLSRKTVVHHLSFISDVFSYAQRMEMVSSNPCSNVIVPKAEPKEKDIYTIEELEQVMDLLETAPLKYRVFFTLLIYTGFRRGEMMGLEWKDINFDAGIISVRRTSNYTVGRGTYTDTTKTKRSKRSRRYPQQVFDLLKEYKKVQDAEKRSMGSKWQEHDRLFTMADGRPMNIGRSQRTLSAGPNGLFTELYSNSKHRRQFPQESGGGALLCLSMLVLFKLILGAVYIN